MVSVPAVTLVVLVSVGKETPLSSTVPLSSDDVPSPKTGWGGAAISPNPPPPIVHRVSVDSNGGPSRLFTFAPLPCMCSVTPVSFGISNCTGLVLEVAAKCQAASATTKRPVASGRTAHGCVSVRVVAVFDVIVYSWSAQVPLMIRTIMPAELAPPISAVLLPTVLAVAMVAANGGCSSVRQ